MLSLAPFILNGYLDLLSKSSSLMKEAVVTTHNRFPHSAEPITSSVDSEIHIPLFDPACAQKETFHVFFKP